MSPTVHGVPFQLLPQTAAPAQGAPASHGAVLQVEGIEEDCLVLDEGVPGSGVQQLKSPGVQTLPIDVVHPIEVALVVRVQVVGTVQTSHAVSALQGGLAPAPLQGVLAPPPTHHHRPGGLFPGGVQVEGIAMGLAQRRGRVGVGVGGGGQGQLGGGGRRLLRQTHQRLLPLQLLLVAVELVVVDERHVGVADHVVDGLQGLQRGTPLGVHLLLLLGAPAGPGQAAEGALEGGYQGVGPPLLEVQLRIGRLRLVQRHEGGLPLSRRLDVLQGRRSEGLGGLATLRSSYGGR